MHFKAGDRIGAIGLGTEQRVWMQEITANFEQ